MIDVRVCIFLHAPYGRIVSIYGVASVLLDLQQNGNFGSQE